jgi:putative PIN family toxin of toxin-antitoxin system
MRAVIDTNVLVEGLNRKGPAGRVIDAWAAGRFVVCVSTAMALEYEAVLSRYGSQERTDKVRRALQALLSRAEFVPILFSYRPISPDPGDDMVIDCAMNARAVVVTSNQKDFHEAAKKLGFELFSPKIFVDRLKKESGTWPG